MSGIHHTAEEYLHHPQSNRSTIYAWIWLSVEQNSNRNKNGRNKAASWYSKLRGSLTAEIVHSVHQAQHAFKGAGELWAVTSSTSNHVTCQDGLRSKASVCDDAQ
jgi:hypothetical protein